MQTLALSDARENVRDPLALNQYVVLSETISVIQPLTTDCFNLIRRDAQPVVGGDLVMGVVGFVRPCPNGDVLATVISEGIAIVQVAAGANIPAGLPLATTADGFARQAVAGEYTFGSAIDTTDGTSTATEPHYIRVRLSTGSIA